MAIFLHEIIPHMHSIGTPDKYPLYMRKYGGIFYSIKVANQEFFVRL